MCVCVCGSRFSSLASSPLKHRCVGRGLISSSLTKCVRHKPSGRGTPDFPPIDYRAGRTAALGPGALHEVLAMESPRPTAAGLKADPGPLGRSRDQKWSEVLALGCSPGG